MDIKENDFDSVNNTPDYHNLRDIFYKVIPYYNIPSKGCVYVPTILKIEKPSVRELHGGMYLDLDNYHGEITSEILSLKEID